MNHVSIIIPALNEQKYIGRCLDALSCIDSSGFSYEIIVVDNGSTDRTVEMAKAQGARVFVKTGVNISSLRNWGAHLANGAVLAFVDADCVVAEDWLKNALQAMDNNGISVTGCVYSVPESTNWVGRASEIISLRRSSGFVNYLPAGNLIIKRTAFERVGGFDESLETSEDFDLCSRLRENGFRILSDNSIQSVHLGTPNSTAQLFKREFWHGASSFHLFTKDWRKPRNGKVFIFSVLVLVFLVNIMAGFCLFIAGHNAVYGPVNVLLFFALIGAVSLRASVTQKTYNEFFHIFAYFTVYGVARGLSLFRYLYKGK